MNSRRRITIVMLTAAFVAALLAGTALAADDKPLRTVSVSGRFSVSLVPDVARLVVAVATEAPTAAAAKNENAGRCDAVIKSAKALGISEEQIKTTGVNLYPADEPRDKDGKKLRRVYRMDTSLTFSKVPVKRVGEVIDAAVRNGANNIESVSYESSDYRNQYLAALKNAVKDALDKAAAMAAAGGSRLGKAVSISQSGGYNPPAVSFARMNKAVDAAEAEMPVMAGTIEITAAVNAVFELLN